MALLSGDVGRKRPWLYSRTHSSAVIGGLHNDRSNQESINVAESSLNCWFVRFTSHPTLITLRGSINYCRSNRFNWYLFAIRRYRCQKCFSLFKYFCLISNRQDSFDFFPLALAHDDGHEFDFHYHPVFEKYFYDYNGNLRATTVGWRQMEYQIWRCLYR